MGERQLVFVALALAQEAPILVLDEPTVHLDIRHQVEVMELLVDLNERDGTTIIAVLHDLALAAHFFPRVVVMAGGRVVADGPPATTLDDARIRAVFGVDPARASDCPRRASLTVALRAAVALLTRLPCCTPWAGRARARPRSRCRCRRSACWRGWSAWRSARVNRSSPRSSRSG